MAMAVKDVSEPQRLGAEEQETTRSSKKKRKTEKAEVAPIEIVDVDSLCFIPFSNRGTTKKDAISVERHSEDRELQWAIAASLFQTPIKAENFIDLENGRDYYCVDGDDDVKILNFKPPSTSIGKKRKPFTFPSVSESGQSSNSLVEFICDICVEAKTASDLFWIMGCSHSYCNDCMIKYVASKLQDNITNIRCPVSDCKGLLEPEYCRSILPKEVFDRWVDALCEAVILGSQKFYCPYKDCSALLIDDGDEIIRESECPNCRRMFCAQCKVMWHAGFECQDFQKLHKDEREKEDIMLMNLAQKQSWRRCPTCRFYVERINGCLYMRCRCGTAFCYNCGSLITGNVHYCTKCKR
ncbi:E3 ubiquitin-protein ligase [Tripterygium wilfordii]|uniref:RBR-type E3 ubiquitin transferase n=1 Tax=Tripterygium wilfordii TaxID=458696 RepID=A0A7J7D9U4_TRIWF|nr:probable E3 ubiquitin-protein ligase RNF217 [Tripterygium wilfordii]KAF5743127.1 E3 ubiquitin-protein ligase [Tripterygium wilfordii]